MSIIKSQFTLRLDLEDHAKIKKIAQKENRSMTNMIETLVKNEINQYENDNGEIILTDSDIFWNRQLQKAEIIYFVKILSRSLMTYLIRLLNC